MCPAYLVVRSFSYSIVKERGGTTFESVDYVNLGQTVSNANRTTFQSYKMLKNKINSNFKKEKK